MMGTQWGGCRGGWAASPQPALRSVPSCFAPSPGRAPPTPQRGARVPPPLRILAAPGAGGSVPAAIKSPQSLVPPPRPGFVPGAAMGTPEQEGTSCFRAPAERARGASARQDLGSPFPAPLPPCCSSPPAPARTPLPRARGRFGWIGAQRGLVERLGVLGGPGMNMGVAEREGGDGVGGAQDPPGAFLPLGCGAHTPGPHRGDVPCPWGRGKPRQGVTSPCGEEGTRRTEPAVSCSASLPLSLQDAAGLSAAL